MEQARLSDSVTKNLIEHYHNDNFLWDVNSANFMSLELKVRYLCDIQFIISHHYK